MFWKSLVARVDWFAAELIDVSGESAGSQEDRRVVNIQTWSPVQQFEDKTEVKSKIMIVINKMDQNWK